MSDASLKRKTYGEGVIVEDPYAQAFKKTKSENICYNCGKEGHFVINCPLPKAFEQKFCHLCGQQGHISKYCTSSLNAARYTLGGRPLEIPTTSALDYTTPAYQVLQANSIKRCYTCNGIGHMGKECPEGNFLEKKCFYCRSTGHLSGACPEKEVNAKCFTCGVYGHMGKNCPQGKEKVCYHCRSTAHLSAECPDRSASTVTCLNCFGRGHWSKECPEPFGKARGISRVERREVEIRAQIPPPTAPSDFRDVRDVYQESLRDYRIRNEDYFRRVEPPTAVPRVSVVSSETCQVCRAPGHSALTCPSLPSLLVNSYQVTRPTQTYSSYYDVS